MSSDNSINVEIDNENCVSCGKELKDGDGRFRQNEKVFCLECHRKVNGYSSRKINFLEEKE